MSYRLDLKIEPSNTIGIVDENNNYYFLSGQSQEENLVLAEKIVMLLNMHQEMTYYEVHGLSHPNKNGGWRDCAAMTHMFGPIGDANNGGCKECLFACHIDRGDWIIHKMCPEGLRIIREEPL